MISSLVSLVRPLIEPLLKLRFQAPELPEGNQTLLRLKPSARYLAYIYTGAVVSHIAPLLVGPLFLFLGMMVDRRAWVLVILGPAVLALTLITLAVALVTQRLDWELRDYLIGSRGLRLREGALVQRELTLSYANVQNVEVTQGPLERLFGFKSLRVSTAGGTQPKPGQHGAPSHEARLVGLEDAEAVRDVVLGALRQQRDTGLGDHPLPSEVPATRARLLEEIRDAAAALRAAAEKRSS